MNRIGNRFSEKVNLRGDLISWYLHLACVSLPLNCSLHSCDAFVGICQMETIYIIYTSGVKIGPGQFCKAPGIVQSSIGTKMWLLGNCQLEVMNDLE